MSTRKTFSSVLLVLWFGASIIPAHWQFRRFQRAREIDRRMSEQEAFPTDTLAQVPPYSLIRLSGRYQPDTTFSVLVEQNRTLRGTLLFSSFIPGQDSRGIMVLRGFVPESGQDAISEEPPLGDVVVEGRLLPARSYRWLFSETQPVSHTQPLFHPDTIAMAESLPIAMRTDSYLHLTTRQPGLQSWMFPERKFLLHAGYSIQWLLIGLAPTLLLWWKRRRACQGSENRVE